MFERSSGVIAHITMLPGPYGCGTFGRDAEVWINKLSESGFTWWQVLPFGHPDLGNSPYTAFSAFAMNPLFADPGILAEDGLLTEEERASGEWRGSPYTVDFDRLIPLRNGLLRRAFARAGDDILEKAAAFTREQADWLPDYALYMTLKDQFEGTDWCAWPDPLANREPAALEAAAKVYADEIAFREFVQWVLHDQWRRLRSYARERGIRILGDMPIYTSYHSSDVWAKPELFQMRDRKLTRVAGVPPDFFNADGQLWGNPLYNWDIMEEDGYAWWLRRIGGALEVFDGLRIDHFRGFSAYWSVPAEAETAKEGEWVRGPGMKLFSRVKEAYPEANIIAEDLGQLDAEVHALIAATGYPGMRVMQFAFASGNDPHLPHNYPVNCAVYTGTHDNNTTLGYFYEASPEERDYACRYIGLEGPDAWRQGGADSPVCRAMMRCLWQSPAMLAVVPYQDLAGWGGDTRMNRPGVPLGNWSVRIPGESLSGLDCAWLRRLNEDFGRLQREPEPAPEEENNPEEGEA